MRLVDCNPYCSTGPNRRLIFTCPQCGSHEIALQFEGEGKQVWQASGSFYDELTLTPSVASMPLEDQQHREAQWIDGSPCAFHFFIRDGEIVPAN